MSKKTECDQCGADLTDAGPRPSFRLKLFSERMPSTSSFTYAISVTPLIPMGGYDFCGAPCLLNWVEAKTDKFADRGADKCFGRDPAHQGFCLMRKGHPGGCFEDDTTDA